MSPSKPAAPRIALLDAWRGAAVITMVLWHLGWDLTDLGFLPYGTMEESFPTAVRYFIVGSFVLLSGISIRFSRNRARRGAITLGAAVLVTLSTWAAGDPAWFGILHMLGCSMLLYALLGGRLERLPEIPAMMGYFILFMVTHVICYRVRVSVPGLFFLGLRTPDFTSSDYYPLLPWGLLFLAGTCMGGILRRSDEPWMHKSAPAPLCWVGRRALWIYLIHQPVLLVLIMLLTGKTIW